jgi:hypothetical protein
MKRTSRWIAPRFVLGAVLSIATVSFAFFLVTTFSGEGSHEGQTGSAAKENHALPVTVSFPDGVTPTNPVPLTLEVENPGSAAATVAGPVVTIETPTDPICGESWLQILPEKFNGEEETVMTEKLAGVNTEALGSIPAGAGPKSIGFYYRSNGGLGAEQVKRFVLEFKPGLSAGTDETSCASAPVKVTAKLTTPH